MRLFDVTLVLALLLTLFVINILIYTDQCFSDLFTNFSKSLDMSVL